MDQVILQWNTQSINNKKSELIYLFNKYKPIVCAVSETWLKPGSRFRVPGYSCVRDDRHDGYAGSALLIDRSHIYTSIPLPNHSDDLNIVAAKVQNISFISVYIPHPNINLLTEVKNIISGIPRPYIILGDFNCNNTLWGSALCDANSATLIGILDELNLCLLNEKAATRRVSPIQLPSAVDLTLVSATLATTLSWKILDQTFGSDHYPIISTIHNARTPPLVINPLLKYKVAQANWSDFSFNLENIIKTLDEINSANFLNMYPRFVEALHESANLSIPLKNTARNKIPSPPWWDSECTNIIRERKDAEIRYSNDISIENYIIFQKTKAKSKRLLSKKKTE